MLQWSDIRSGREVEQDQAYPRYNPSAAARSHKSFDWKNGAHQNDTEDRTQ